MLYLLLIYNREQDWETASDAQKALDGMGVEVRAVIATPD